MKEEEVVDPAHLHMPFPIQTSSEEEWRTKRLGGGQIQMIQGVPGPVKTPLIEDLFACMSALVHACSTIASVAHKRRNLSLCFFFCQRQNGGYRSRIGQMPGGETASGGEEQGICRNELKSISWHYEFFGPTPYKIIDNLCTNSPITTLPDCSLLYVCLCSLLL